MSRFSSVDFTIRGSTRIVSRAPAKNTAVHRFSRPPFGYRARTLIKRREANRIAAITRWRSGFASIAWLFTNYPPENATGVVLRGEKCRLKFHGCPSVESQRAFDSRRTRNQRVSNHGFVCSRNRPHTEFDARDNNERGASR